MGQILHGSATHCYPAGDLQGKSAERARTRSEQQYSDPLAGSRLRSTTMRSASFERGAEPGVGHQRQDRRQVAQ
ncbi:hypothetical protein, partial [Salipiger aestuarii]|uniref:hypothetical protein n=1 Tax=Salipiger aestuarii TaxID=568098 RepID=UPI001B86F60A